MRIFCALILISSSVHAVTLSQVQSSSNYSGSQKFEINGKKGQHQKLTNLFDSKKDWRLGQFTLEDGRLKEIEQSLKGTLAKLQATDKALRSTGSSFNELSDKTKHAPTFYLEDFIVSEGSNLYPELKSIFIKLQELPWKHQQGVRLSNDYKQVYEVDKGQEGKPKAFDFAFNCREKEPPSSCSFKSGGNLLVE